MAQIIMTKTQAKSRTSKAIEIRRRGLMGYLNDCKKVLQGGKGMNLTQDEIAAYKSLKGMVSLTPADCTIDFIKAYIPTDEQGRFVRFIKVGEDRQAWCEKHKVEPTDPQFTFVKGKDGSEVEVYREVRTTWTASQVVGLLVKAADARTKAAKKI